METKWQNTKRKFKEAMDRWNEVVLGEIKDTKRQERVKRSGGSGKNAWRVVVPQRIRRIMFYNHITETYKINYYYNKF